MNIRYLTHPHIDTAAWDNCIRKAVNGNVYAYSWYLDLVSENWDALILDDYEVVFPLTFKRKAGVYFLYQPFFTQQLGIFSTKHLTPEVVDLFLKSIPKKFRFGEINLNVLNKPDEKVWHVRLNLNHELDLIEPYESVKKRYAENARRNLKKAKKNNLVISTTVKPEELVSLFRQNKGRQIQHLKEHNYRRLLRLLYQCMHDQKAILYGAYTSENTICAGIVLVFSHRKAIFLFSAANDTARENGAMFLLIDRFIQDSTGNHLTLDFEGSNDANLARFYRSFGSVPSQYPTIRFNRLSPPIRMLVYLAKQFRKLIIRI